MLSNVRTGILPSADLKLVEVPASISGEDTRGTYPVSGPTDLKEKVVFIFDDQPWHGYASEPVWAKRLSGHLFQILNTPFFAKDVSYLDVVVAEEEIGQNVYKSIAQRSGHSTYRIIPIQDIAPAIFDEYWRDLESLGCTYEEGRLGYTLFAVDIPPSVDLNTVYDALTRGEDDDVWGVEEGHAYLRNRLS